MNVKQILLYSCILVVIVVLIAVASFFAGRHNALRGSSIDAGRIGELESDLESQAETISGLTSGLRTSQQGIFELSAEIAETRAESEQFEQRYNDLAERVRNIGGSLPEDIERLEGVIERFDYYIEQAKTSTEYSDR